MEIKVHCPGCRAVLRVPTHAAGHIARCPACHAKFKVPDPDEIAEQTASHWIEEDIEDLQQKTDDQWRQKLKEAAEQRAREDAERLKKTASEIEKVMNVGAAGESSGGTATATAAAGEALDAHHRPDAPVRRVTEMPPGSRHDRAESPVSSPRRRGEQASDAAPHRPVARAVDAAPAQLSRPSDSPATDSKPADAAPAPVAEAGHAPSPPAAGEAVADALVSAPATIEGMSSAAAPPAAAQYPQFLFASVDHPHLLVSECTQKGVRLAFDSSFLRHERFRTSMPIACAITGESTRTKLLAKPLAFTDRSQGTIRNPRDIEQGHEAKMRDSQSAREAIAIMGVLDNLPTPFNLPMPYYVAVDHSAYSLLCTTTRRDDGGITCYMSIPDGRYALSWLRNVNGICGDEYDLLRSEVSMLWRDEWVGLEERVRERLDTWCHFQPGERFRYYINDADLTKKDEGLAGVVLTDRRLIYHKYHRHGEVSFHQADASLTVRPDGQFAGLTVKTADGSVRAARFHFDELEKLRDAVRDLGISLSISKK